MKLIKKLQECSTLGQADPILTRLGAGPAVKKLVETALILSNSQDPQQRNHAYSFMESAIRELENADVADENHPPVDKNKQGHLEHDQNEPVSPIQEEDDDDDKPEREQKDDDENEHKIHEEELDNHNNGPREDGSEQSTQNREPYPGTARDSDNGEKPMQDMSKTENQWNETGGMPPGGGGMPPTGGNIYENGGGMPPSGGGMPPNGGGSMMMPGLAPDIAQEMGMILPKLPPMDTNQMMKQMQYTVENLYKKEVAPLYRIIKQEREARIQANRQLKEIQSQQKDAIKTLSQELRETSAANGTMKLDLDTMRKNAPATFRETESAFQPQPMYDNRGLPTIQPISDKQPRLHNARAEIEQMDKLLNSKSKSIYQ